jgi:hypothetical protein
MPGRVARDGTLGGPRGSPAPRSGALRTPSLGSVFQDPLALSRAWSRAHGQNKAG